MGNRTAKFISALFASIIAGIPLSAESQNAPGTPAAADAQNAPSASNSADDCLRAPKGTAPEGQHWYYRLERGTKRQCWYLREEGTKSAQSAQTTQSAPATQSTQATQSAPATAPAQKADKPAPRSVQDARAELTAQSPAPDTTASIPAPSAPGTPPATLQRQVAASDADAGQPTVDARWPDPNVSPSPAPQAAPAPKLADARPAPKPQASASAGTMTLASADAPLEKPTGSLQTLLLVIGGALALAGIIGSVIYRFAGARKRARASEGRHRVNWDKREQPADNTRAPWADAAGSTTLRTERLRPVDFGFALAQANKAAVASNLDAQEAGRDGLEEDLSEDLRKRFAQDLTAKDEGLAEDLNIEEWANEDLAIEDLNIEPKGSTEPRLAALEFDTHATDADADAVDIDAITAILERLAKEGPRLAPSSPEADLADLVQSQRRQSAARA
ncbi:hypothetical protein NLM33_03960 [Bradyrhizobium sp. CCGUVB1N3]|uniref:hypothetical protein n=1 Tax=Bradyrhizobium sp. CCGUVB1N3 TaxID=2949629 RepID=UPI0020B1BD97|nr:hypothetical protein [Bradyrhizobium sp. CCGUVB1N3]MCP3469482.1 hypothetical protein [Bradyrhizobium sp. CCGUVB1N3]